MKQRAGSGAVVAAALLTAAWLLTACETSRGPDPLSFGNERVGSPRFPVGQAISPLVLPAATGGAPPLSYSLRGELPSGLSFASRTRTLSGTPALVGSYRLTFRATDADGDSVTLDVTVTITPAATGTDDHGDNPDAATTIEPGTPQRGRIGTDADVDYFAVAVNPASVRVVAAARAEGVVVQLENVRRDDAGSSAGHRDWGTLRSPRPEQVWVRVSAPVAINYELAVWVYEAGADRFDIKLVYRNPERPDAAERAAFRAAADVWEEVISAGLPDLPMVTMDWSNWGCEDQASLAFGDAVDDLVIFVTVAPIKGPTGLTGLTGPAASSTICLRRSGQDGGLPLVGGMTFAPAHLAELARFDFLESMVRHQIAHVLGFGLLWDEQSYDLLADPSLDPTGKPVSGDPPDTHFAGTHARDAFAKIAGAYTGARVPVENDTRPYGPGELDVHWRESVFRYELMSTLLNVRWGVSGPAEAAPLSQVTVASLADLDYKVDSSRAEAYRLRAASAGRSQHGPAPHAAAAGTGYAPSCGVTHAPGPPPVADLPAGLVRFVNAGI